MQPWITHTAGGPSGNQRLGPPPPRLPVSQKKRALRLPSAQRARVTVLLDAHCVCLLPVGILMRAEDAELGGGHG